MIAPPTNRGRLAGRVHAGLYVGLGRRPVPAAAVEPANGRPFLLVSALISLAIGADRRVRAANARTRRPAPRALSRPVSQFAARRGGGRRIGMIFLHHLAMGRSTRGSAVPGPGGWRCSWRSHSRRGAYQYPVGRVSDAWIGARSSPASARSPRWWRSASWRSAPCLVRYFWALAALFSGSALTLYSLGRLACERQARAGADGGGEQRPAQMNGTAAAVRPVLAGA